MIFLPILFFSAGVVTCAYSNAVTTEDDAENPCPPPENIAPCTCFKTPYTNRVTARCSNITNSNDIKAMLERNPNWVLQDVWIVNSSLPYIPSKLLEDVRFETLNVSSTSLVTLFDKSPVRSPEYKLVLYEVKIMRGLKWKDFAHTSLVRLDIRNMTIRSLGSDFKKYMPRTIFSLFLENTGMTSMTNGVFSRLSLLRHIYLKRASLKKYSRAWFSRPWNGVVLDFSYNKISALPEDAFEECPLLSFFTFEGNLLHTISETMLTTHKVFYSFGGNPLICNCDMKWIVGKTFPDYLSGKCVGPKAVKGRELKSLKASDFSYCH